MVLLTAFRLEFDITEIIDNGCVCCSVRGDLVRTFNMLVGKRKEFDAIIIETTGLVFE